MTNLIELTRPEHRCGISQCPGIWKTEDGKFYEIQGNLIQAFIANGGAVALGEEVPIPEARIRIPAEILEAALCQGGAEPVAVVNIDTLIAGRVEKIIQRIAELPDRSSPNYWPEAMLVTSKELEHICTEEFAEFEFKAIVELSSLQAENAKLKDELGILRHRFQIQEEINHNLREVLADLFHAAYDDGTLSVDLGQKIATMLQATSHPDTSKG